MRVSRDGEWDVAFARGDISSVFFFFNDTATTEIYTLSLHDALPIYHGSDGSDVRGRVVGCIPRALPEHGGECRDRKSTRLNSSHSQISYAVFCLKKKKTPIRRFHPPPSLARPPMRHSLRRPSEHEPR